MGLGYIRLGQPATTLSGGEAQRVKLSTELSRRATGKTLYILDEPTTGLSFEDVNALLRVLQRLVDAGNTVVVIEHHLDVVKSADHIIDLGPLGGDRGGEIVAEGTPEEVAQVEHSFTGQYLRDVLARHAEREKVAAEIAGSMRDEILTYWEMCAQERGSFQRGMYFREPPAISVVLMSRRPGAPMRIPCRRTEPS